MMLRQREVPRSRDPVTQVILGAEPFEFGEGDHAVLFLHGWTSSPRELRFLAEKAAREGFRCRGPLLRGHGTTLRDLEKVSFADHLEECEREFARLAMAHKRVTVCGLSMGGLLALHLAARRKVANLVLLAPFLRPWGKTLGIPNDWLLGRVPLAGNLPKRGSGPINDPGGASGHIAYHAMPSLGLLGLIRGYREFAGLASRVVCPTLILHSTGDRTSDFTGSLELMRSLGSEDRTLTAYTRSNHVLTLDYDRPRVESTAVEWLTKRKLEG